MPDSKEQEIPSVEQLQLGDLFATLADHAGVDCQGAKELPSSLVVQRLAVGYASEEIIGTVLSSLIVHSDLRDEAKQ
jgi:hypothetical protein